MSKEIFKSQFRECLSSLRVEYDCIEDKDEDDFIEVENEKACLCENCYKEMLADERD